MNERKLTCIGCPLGCMITVKTENGEIVELTGYTCKRGETYARQEVTNPARTVTTTVRVSGGKKKLVPVKTKGDIPKEKIFECLRELAKVEVEAPVEAGDVILKKYGRDRD